MGSLLTYSNIITLVVLIQFELDTDEAAIEHRCFQRKSMVCVMRPSGEVLVPLYEVRHTESELNELSKLLRSLEGETRLVMEATSNYRLPIAQYLHDAGFFVSAVSAILVHDYDNNSLRRAKTDKKDSIKLAQHGLATDKG